MQNIVSFDNRVHGSFTSLYNSLKANDLVVLARTDLGPYKYYPSPEGAIYAVEYDDNFFQRVYTPGVCLFDVNNDIFPHNVIKGFGVTADGQAYCHDSFNILIGNYGGYYIRTGQITNIQSCKSGPNDLLVVYRENGTVDCSEFILINLKECQSKNTKPFFTTKKRVKQWQALAQGISVELFNNNKTETLYVPYNLATTQKQHFIERFKTRLAKLLFFSLCGDKLNSKPKLPTLTAPVSEILSWQIHKYHSGILAQLKIEGFYTLAFIKC